MVSWIDEAGAVLDPTRRASETTEKALLQNAQRTVGSAIGGTGGGTSMMIGRLFVGQDTPTDEGVDLSFQRPEELGLGSEDSQDLPFGSFRNPASDPDFSEPTVGPDPWANTPDFIPSLINRGGIGSILLLVGGLVLLWAFVSSLAQGVGQGLAS